MSESCDTTDLKAPNMYSAPRLGLASSICLLLYVCFHVIVLLWFGLHKFLLFYSCCFIFLHKLKIQNDSSVDMQTFYL